MAEKLKFLFAKPAFKLVLKVFAFCFSLFLLGSLNFSGLGFFLFFLINLFIYLSQLSERIFFRVSFLWLILISVLALKLLNVASFSDYLFFVYILFSILFFFVLALADFLFSERKKIYIFLNTFLFLIFAFLVNLAVQTWFGGIKSFSHLNFVYVSVLIFIFSFFLFKECFNFIVEERFKKRFFLVCFCLSFLLLQLFWAVSLIQPAGLVLAAYLILFFVFLRDFSLFFFQGLLKQKLVLHFSLFIILFLALLIV